MRRAAAGVVFVLAVGLLAAAGDQEEILDRGTFTITHQGTVVGRETFVIRAGRTSGGGPGYTITATAAYPPDDPTVTLAPIVELGPDSMVMQLQLDETDQTPRRLLARFAGRRVTVRIVSPAGESAREYPESPHPVALDDSVFALYAMLPPPPATVGAFFPRAGRRVTLRLTDAGSDTATVKGTVRIWKHVALGAGDDVRHLWYDAAGHLMAVEIPRLGLRAER